MGLWDKMRILRRINAKKTVVTIVIFLLGSLATAYWMHRARWDFTAGQNLWKSVSWRTQLYLRKAEGDIPDLSWPELWEITRTKGGFALEHAISEGKSVEAGITNPYVSRDDHEAGSRIFSARCAACHGSGGTGLQGPSLIRSGFKHGDSDLAIYKVLREGVVGTPMVATGLSFVERWQVIGYLRTLQQQLSTEVQPFPLDIHVSSEELQTPESKPDEWLTYSGSLKGWRYSQLSEITPTNVQRLRVLWVHQSSANESRFESTPLVVNKTIFTTEPPATVLALDAKAGDVIWRYDRSFPSDLPICCGAVNRGLAILSNALFFGALDGHLIAINANNGEVIWQTQVANPANGLTMTGAPLIVNQSVVVGVSGGEYGVRGFLAAYDAVTGQQQWKFYTIPAPGERGHKTWENDAWRTGGGPTWVTGSYDPALDLLYWGVGNPSPVFSGDGRPGDNLFTNSVIALRGSSGELAWYFQFTPHDEHDWDSAQTPILADVMINGAERKVICWANRNGFYYVLDRVTGEFLAGVPFVEQNWAKALDPSGRPILSDAQNVTVGGRLTRPSLSGGTNWQPAAFRPDRGLFFVHATEGASVFTKSRNVRRGDQRVFIGSGGGFGSELRPPVAFVRALDVITGAKRWEYRSPPIQGGCSGLLVTAGGLVFGASGGTLFSLNDDTGEELWRISLGGETLSAPISFTLDGRQVIAVSAGRALFVFGL